MIPAPHLDKLRAALRNPKCVQDVAALQEGLELHREWTGKMSDLSSKGRTRVEEMVSLLNWYKREFEVNLVMRKGSAFLYRQKGQLKLDNSIVEEFLVHLSTVM